MNKSTQIISGIYKILNTKNNKVYIGSSINIEKRFGEHLRALKGSYHNNNHLQSAWNKYGKSNFIFTIIETCSIKNLVEIEQFWMDYYNVTNDIKGYNITPRADRTVMSERTKTKISKANKGNKHTKEAIQRMSVTQQKRAQAPNYTPPMEGKKHTKEAKEKISEVHKGKIISDETKLKCLRPKKEGNLLRKQKLKYPLQKKDINIQKKQKGKCLLLLKIDLKKQNKI